MAFYDYFCDKCKKKFELIFPIGKAPQEVNCIFCKLPAKRVLGGFMISSKGNNSDSFGSSVSSGTSSCSSCITKNCASCGS